MQNVFFILFLPLYVFLSASTAAAAEHKSVKDLLLEMIDGKIQELEKKGLLPKMK